MAEPYYLHSMTLTGFRAYLQPKKFDFSKKPCLAIFAPNGLGKSCFIDALEFILSKEGTLEHLGKQASGNHAGPKALEHNLAGEKGIVSSVTINVKSGENIEEGTRKAAGNQRFTPPEVVTTINACFTVSPIIRGHALRTFVETHTPEQRYRDIANWLQLGPLVEVQNNLRALRKKVKAAAEDTKVLDNFNTDLIEMTDQKLKTGSSVDEVLFYTNTHVLAPLDPTLVLKALDVLDPAYVELGVHVKKEENKIGLDGLRANRNAAADVWEKTVDSESGMPIVNGIVPIFDDAVKTLSAALEKKNEEYSKAAETVFQTVWKAAEPLFAKDAEAPVSCPICTTPITDTKLGSVEAIHSHVANHLEELADYAAAKEAYEKAKSAATSAHDKLLVSLRALINLLGPDDATLKSDLSAYQRNVEGWSTGVAPTSAGIVTSIATLLTRLNEDIYNIEKKQGDHTYFKAKEKIYQLLVLENKRKLALQTKTELEKLSKSLTEQAAKISTEIRRKVQLLLDKLQKPMNDIYEMIQDSGAKPIRLELPGEDKTTQQQLSLLIDFANNRTGVQPSGYLSDSQLHSVALAFRLAAIKQFNIGAPIIALDDIVTSYDADHRLAIAKMIATMFDGYQILITTHDERFFNYLKEQLKAKTFHFTRITKLDPAVGPKFTDHKVTEEMIEARWAKDQSAANEMRQAEEEWLLGICRDFGVKVRIRSLENPYAYSQSELAQALSRFLKGVGLQDVNNGFLESLARGVIENFGSHSQDGRYGDGSRGDEKKRWEEFETFRKQFVCKKCGRSKFKRTDSISKPICAHNKCEAQFEA